MQVPSSSGSRTGLLSASIQPVIHEFFSAQAAQFPEHIAVEGNGERLTYRELETLANRLARRLQQMGVGPESLVALYLDRSCQTVAAILGVLKAGGAYVPIDLEYPAERIRFMLEDARPVLLLTEQKLTPRLPREVGKVLLLDDVQEAENEAANASAPRSNVNPDNAAYVIYTSGSTGKPKGVVVTHRNVVRLFTSTEPWYGFGPSDVWTLFHSLAFDFSVWELWGALLYGGKLIVVPYLISRSPEAFHELLVREKVTVLNQTPSAFRQLAWADQVAPPSSKMALRYVIFGGEALELQSLKPWFDRHGDKQPQLVNMYGITETTVHVTYRPIHLADLQAGRGSVIGCPIPDLSLHILDEHGQSCPVGVAGEIYVGGAGVARGYLGRPELNREKFIVNPCHPGSGDRLYRSGDSARRLPDGDVEYLGRIDQQVKIRGFRIELGEIETALNGHPRVRESVVVARSDATGGKRLVAYLVCQPGNPPIEELRTYLRLTLPEYMVPSAFVFLSRLPLTVHGKVDRQALPAPEQVRPAMGNEFVPPTTLAEKTLATIWEDVLQIDQVGVHDNFFALGGDSIRSIQVLARAHEMGYRISLQQLFEQPVIFELARCRGTQDQDWISTAVSPFSHVAAADRGLIPESIEDAYPMTKLQIGMLYHSQRHPDSAIFHDVFSFRFSLPFDQEKFTRAVQQLATRHAIYRTGFDLGRYSQPLQLVSKAVTIPLTIEDLRSQTPQEQKVALVDWVEREKRSPFQWGQAPLMRLHVQRYTPGVFQLVVSFHHAIMDGWSLAAMLTELFQDYGALLDGRQDQISAPPVSYRDFVVLEERVVRSPEARAFWSRKVENPTVHRLPRWPTHCRQGGREQVRGPEIVLNKDLLHHLKQLANSSGVPLRSVLLAAHCRVMALVTGQPDVLTGLVTNGRPQVVGGERLIGLFLNTLPFRLQLDTGTWRELVTRTFVGERELIPFRRFPLAEIQQLAGQPLFETVFDFVQFHVYRDLPGYGERTFLEDYFFEANDFTFYVTFMLDADGSELQFHFDYDPNELCADQVRALCDYFSSTLEAIAHNPDAPWSSACLLPRAERDRLLLEWNNTSAPYPELCVHELISTQAAATPDAIAVVCGDEQISYADLDRLSSALAAQLREQGVGMETLVGIQQKRSTTMLISVLAVLKAGGAYVPLDPNYPRERLEFMVHDAALELILSQSGSDRVVTPARCRVLEVDKVLERLPQAAAGLVSDVKARPDQLAYVIYTSGSTGKPKGVQITHRALVNFLTSMQREPGLTSSDVLLAVTTLSFDIAALELFLPLTVGARVVIAPAETVMDPLALASTLEEHGATLLQATPTTWNLLIQSGWKGNSRLKALCGGEPLSRELANNLLARCQELWNMYGPTETTVWSCLHQVTPGAELVPIGRPINNTEVLLLNENLELVPTGTDGEICLGGDGLARGYLHRPDLTTEKFVPHPFPARADARLYRTGDVGRRLPDGTLICLGRKDQQLKIRGVRVEPGEIESALAEHPVLTGAVVTAKNDASGNKQLVAYYTVRNGCWTSAPELRTFLEAKLPPAIVPSVFVALPEFPTTANGKVDRTRLPEPTATSSGPDRASTPPRTPLEQSVAQLWEQVLNVEGIGLEDDFFKLGGHSLLAVQVVARVRQQFQVDLGLAALFENPRLESFVLHLLTLLVEQDQGPKPSSALASVARPISTPREAAQPVTSI